VTRLLDERPRLAAPAALVLVALVAATMPITRSVASATSEQRWRAQHADQRAREARAALGRQASAANRARARPTGPSGGPRPPSERAPRRLRVARRWKARAPYVLSGGRSCREPLQHNHCHRHGRGRHGQQRLTQAARPDPQRPRQNADAPVRHRPPQANPGRGGGVGQHMGAVAAPTAGGDGGAHLADHRSQEGTDHGQQRAGGERMGQAAVASEQREDNQRQPPHRAEGGERRVAMSEPPAPMDARAEAVGVGQPRAPVGPGGCSGGFERLQVERPRRRYGPGDADKLVGGVAHAQQANRAAGQFRATSPSRPCKLVCRRDGNPADELDAEQAA
jgi:hypothetical protein